MRRRERSRDQGSACGRGPACALASPLAFGQAASSLVGGDVQKRANGVLALMGYMLTPDVTTGSLAISNATTGNPDFGMSTLGGGFTVSRESPLYLEGTLGYARYDPTFVASNGQVERSVAAKWDAYSATGGIGWSFPLARGPGVAPDLQLLVRPRRQQGIGERPDRNRRGDRLPPRRAARHLRPGRLAGARLRALPARERDRPRAALHQHLPAELRRQLDGGEGQRRRAEREPVDPLARADRHHDAGAAAALRARVRPHQLPRRPGRRARVQSPDLARRRPRARLERPRHHRDAHAADGALQVRRHVSGWSVGLAVSF